jgi:2-polyprenyl-3-methyl-5-hydroxy-6-metoxy-1,4-benzoquinol methylase
MIDIRDPRNWNSFDRIVQTMRIDKILALFPKNVKNCIEIGCSSGYILNRVESKFKVACTGLDADSKAKFLCNKFYPRIEFLNINLRDIGYNRKWDVVLLPEIIEHTYYPDELIATASKIARKRIIVTTPNRNCIDNEQHYQIFDQKRLYDILNKNIPKAKKINVYPVCKDSVFRKNKLFCKLVGRISKYLHIDDLFFKYLNIGDSNNSVFLLGEVWL